MIYVTEKTKEKQLEEFLVNTTAKSHFQFEPLVAEKHCYAAKRPANLVSNTGDNLSWKLKCKHKIIAEKY